MKELKNQEIECVAGGSSYGMQIAAAKRAAVAQKLIAIGKAKGNDKLVAVGEAKLGNAGNFGGNPFFSFF